MGFTSRKQKLIKYFLLIKEAEQKKDVDSLREYIPELKFLRLTDNEIKEMELEKYFKER